MEIRLVIAMSQPDTKISSIRSGWGRADRNPTLRRPIRHLNSGIGGTDPEGQVNYGGFFPVRIRFLIWKTLRALAQKKVLNSIA